MKKLKLFVLLSFSFSSITFAQKSPNDSTLIIQLENNWAKALITHDEKVFNNLLADDFFYTENEKMYSREEVLASVMSTAETITDAFNEDVQVHMKEKTAIVTGGLYVIGKNTEGDFKRKYRFTDIWYNQKGNWKLIAAHDYLIP